MLLEDSYIIIGAGVFGASTALELAKAGCNVVVLERSADGYHSPDAASNDLNKIVRADYSDEHYRDLGKEAISIWRRSDLLSPYYHETGVLFYAEDDASSSKDYIREGVSRACGTNPASLGLELPRKGHSLPPAAYSISSQSRLEHSFPPHMKTKMSRWASKVESGSMQAYFNPRGGWGEADSATRAVLDEAKRNGAQVRGDSCIDTLLFDSHTPPRVIGVRTSRGEEHKVSGNGQVIICAGAWAHSLLHDLLPVSIKPRRMPTWPSAQCVVALQLDEEQRRSYAGAPVVLDFTNGFYCFEPDKNGVMKIAIHSDGYQNPAPSRSTSVPVAFPSFSAGEKDSGNAKPSAAAFSARSEKFVPADKLAEMLSLLARIYPELANAPVKYTRICFYSDSEDENWIIDHLPNVTGLVVASGDSGHAFKFLPVLGSLVCGRLGLPSVAGLTAHQKKVFSFDYHYRLHDEKQKQKVKSSVEKVRFRL